MHRKLESSYRILTLGLICLAVLSRYAQSDFVLLQWPGRQMMPGILERIGLLSEDFYASSAGETPYVLATSVAAMFFQDSRVEAVMQFSLYSAFLEIACIFLTTVLIYKFIAILVRPESTVGSLDLAGYLPVLQPFVGLYLFAASNDMFHLAIPSSAGWSLPLRGTLNPQGISWTLSLCALLLWRFQNPITGFFIL